jgi:hypothetical protein
LPKPRPASTSHVFQLPSGARWFSLAQKAQCQRSSAISASFSELNHVCLSASLSETRNSAGEVSDALLDVLFVLYRFAVGTGNLLTFFPEGDGLTGKLDGSQTRIGVVRLSFFDYAHQLVDEIVGSNFGLLGPLVQALFDLRFDQRVRHKIETDASWVLGRVRGQLYGFGGVLMDQEKVNELPHLGR